MATQALIQPFYRGSRIHKEREFRGGPEEPHFKEAASQSFGIGGLIYLDSGELKTLGLTGTQVNTVIAGQAKKAASGTTGAEVHFYVIRSDEYFDMNVYHATPASAVTAQAQLGSIRGLVRVNGVYHVDIENAVEGGADALARVKIVNFPKKAPDGTTNTIGDTYGLVRVCFLEFSAASDFVPFQRNLQL